MKRFILCLTAASLCAGAWATPLSPGAGTDRFSVKADNLPAAGTYRVTPV